MAASGLNLILKERKNQIPDAGGKIPDLVSGQEKSVRAGSGTLTHLSRDKIFTKWVAIKDSPYSLSWANRALWILSHSTRYTI